MHSRSRFARYFVLFALVAAMPLESQDRVDRVLLASDSHRQVEAYFSPDVGLWLRGFDGRERTVLGHGSEPRFDDRGRLWFRRAFDDGHDVTRSIVMRLDPGTRTPRIVREAGPRYVLPRAAQPSSAAVKVVVDAGHGGRDPGAVGNGLRESDVNLAVALRLQALLDLDTKDTRGGGEWSVLMTRTTDTYVSLAGRTNAANAFGAASFLSIHMNGFHLTSANGSETFCYRGQENAAGGRYRNRLQTELLSAWGLRNRGVKSAGFYVLRYTRMPAALLEGGFITNATDASRMKDASRLDRLALGILWAMQEHHGFKRYTPSRVVGGNGLLRGVVYDITQGTGTRIPNATVVLSTGASLRASASTAAFSFSLKEGNYTYYASAPGYLPAQLTRSVFANQTVWGSAGLRPATLPSIDGPASTRAGNALALTVRADANSPVLLLVGGRPKLVAVGSFGVLIPDLATSVTLAAGVVAPSGQLVLRIPTSAQLRGFEALVQPFALRSRAWKLGNAAGIRID